MRTFLPGWLLLATLVIACQKPLFPTASRLGRAVAQPRERPAGGGASVPAPDTAAGMQGADIYLTALRFPEGVDWRADPLSEGAQVVLFKNGREVLSLAVDGPPDPERHRVQHGKLWTDATDGACTVVCCNGVERFRHQGAELYRGFLESGGAVHTLGQRQGWEGLCYRIDGKEVFSAPTGTILGSADDREWPGGAFSEDSSGLYYTYGIPVRTADGLLWEYRVMRGDYLEQTLPAGAVKALFDIRVLDGVVYRSERRGPSVKDYYLVAGQQEAALALGAREIPHLCKLAPRSGQMLVKGFSTSATQSSNMYWYREPGNLLKNATADSSIADLLWEGDRAVHLTLDGQGRVQEVLEGREPWPVPLCGHRLATPRCAAAGRGIIGLALSAAEGNDHLVLLDGEAFPYTFNGYFTSMVID